MPYVEMKTREVVQEENALNYVLTHTTEQERNELLLEWFFSGNWIKEKDDG